MDFTQSWDFGDLTFIIESRKIYVNKAVLVMSSEVFRAMFTSDFAEKKMTEIPLPDKKFDDFLQLMQILHPPHDKSINGANLYFKMDFTQPWDFYGDVIFIVEDRKIYANQATLAMSSDMFKVMFTSEFKEKHMTEIPLPDKMFDEFLELMQILHPPHDKAIDDTNVESLLHLAHEYQINHVMERCVTILLKQPPSIHNLILADKFSLTKLRRICMNYIKSIPYHELNKIDDFKEVDRDTLLEVLEHKLNVKEDQDIQELKRQPPSIKTLLLAEKHKLPELHEKCVKYAKETSLAKLKEEDGFYDIKPSILCEVLSHQIKDLTRKNTELDGTIHNLNSNNNGLTKTNNNLSRKNSDLNNQISNLYRTNTNLQNENWELHNKVKTRYCQCVLV